MMSQNYHYFAFISYNHHDVRWGKRLQRKLEGYRLPTTVCSEKGLERKPMKPIFFAPTDIQPGDLTEELKARLRASRNLVVVCSPHAAQSNWVAQEIEYFHSLGRAKNIYFFIVEGTPNSNDPETECYNPIIKELGLSGVLGSNVNERNFRLSYLNHERAYVQLITKMLGIEFDALWQRHKRQLAERIALAASSAIVAIVTALMAWNANLPVDVNVCIKESTRPNIALPQLSSGTVTIHLDNDTVSKDITSVNNPIVFPNIPKRMMGKQIRVTFNGEHFLPLDIKNVTLSPKMELPIQRDTLLFGRVQFTLRDSKMQKISGCRVVIEGIEAISDREGVVELYIPLDNQKTEYIIECEKPLQSNRIMMPCTGSEVIFTH